ncbi:phage terminase large subunit [Gallibacterium salpingitidis]|uniref:phage terminase large subunit n=1 Tax=Gallibacterium salpingitidis TaxID=505341 RepID=UPI0008270A68|nr:phage terminase large subunit [Gallibacterium salpingitidis]
MMNLDFLENLNVNSLNNELARRTLIDFTQVTKPDFITGWFNQIIAQELQQFYQDVIDGKQPRLMIFAPPRSGKSELFSRRFPAWAFGKNPNLQMIACSYSADLASRMNRDVQRIMDDELYHDIFPNSSLNSKRISTLSGQALRNSEIFEILGHSGAYRSAGVGGGITGMGADIAIIDDPVKDAKEANSQTIRDSVWDWYTTTLYTRLSPKSGVLLGMTRWHEDDLAGRLIKEMEQGGDQWRIVSFPAIAEQDEEYRKEGEPLHPERFSLERLENIKKAVGSHAWNALYQQRPVNKDGGIFKPSQIEIIEALPAGKINWIRAWDLGATVGGDPTAGVKLGKTQEGLLIIADLAHGDLGADERDRMIKNTASLDGRQVEISLPQDPGQAGKTQVLYLTRMLQGYIVRSSPESGDKITRAEPFAAQVNVGNVKMLKGAWNKTILDEMKMFPNGKHDDCIDACSRAYGELIDLFDVYGRFTALGS